LPESVAYSSRAVQQAEAGLTGGRLAGKLAKAAKPSGLVS